MVKVVDLATALVELAVVLLAFLLLLPSLEHWVVPGGFSFAVRCALFGVLVGGVGYFAYRRLWPLCARAINPVYAAQAIEQGSPSLKNSLINLLLFRQRRAEISDAVYQTLEEQAAQGLTRVPVDAAVDQSLLIRFGYVLIAIVAIGGAVQSFLAEGSVRGGRARADAVGRYRAGEPRDDCGDYAGRGDGFARRVCRCVGRGSRPRRR